MILVKGFLRQKSSKMYFAISFVSLITISTLLILNTHYRNIVSDIYRKNSYILVTGKEDYFSRLKSQKSIVDIENVLLIESDNVKLSEEKIQTSQLSDGNKNYVIILSDKGRYNLKESDLIVEVPEFILKNTSEYSMFKHTKIGVRIKNDVESFIIKDVISAKFNRLIINSELYDELIKKSNFHSYVLRISDYGMKDEVVKYLSNINGIEMELIESYEFDSEIDTIQSISSLIDTISIICSIVIFLFSVIFLVLSHNILSDEMLKMRLELYLGYNNRTIKKLLLLKITTLNIILIILYSTLFGIIAVATNSVFNLSIYDYFDLTSIFYILLGTLITPVPILLLIDSNK